MPMLKEELLPGEQPLSFSNSVFAALSSVNTNKAADPDGSWPGVQDLCAGVFTDIFNLSLAQAAVPICFNSATIVLVLNHLNVCLPPIPNELAYCPNRSTKDAISMTLHFALTHLDNPST